MTLEELGAFFTTERPLDWAAARTAVEKLDPEVLWNHPQSDSFFDWEAIQEAHADELPARPTAADMRPFMQDLMRVYVDSLEAATATATSVKMPADTEWHFEPNFRYGHAFRDLGGDLDSLGVVSEPPRTIYFTISVLTAADFDDSLWELNSAIWILGASGVLEAAGAKEWVE